MQAFMAASGLDEARLRGTLRDGTRFETVVPQGADEAAPEAARGAAMSMHTCCRISW